MQALYTVLALFDREVMEILLKNYGALSLLTLQQQGREVEWSNMNVTALLSLESICSGFKRIYTLKHGQSHLRGLFNTFKTFPLVIHLSGIGKHYRKSL
jgi:hypothetical protein